MAFGDDGDGVRVVRVLRLGHEERGEGDVLPAPESFAADLPEEILVVGRADDADVLFAEELDLRRDDVPCFTVTLDRADGGPGRTRTFD
jgi:hypothetical protein